MSYRLSHCDQSYHYTIKIFMCDRSSYIESKSCQKETTPLTKASVYTPVLSTTAKVLHKSHPTKRRNEKRFYDQ